MDRNANAMKLAASGVKELVDEFARCYSNSASARISTCLLPFGSAVDILLMSRASSIERNRALRFLLNVNECLSRLDYVEMDASDDILLEYLADIVNRAKTARTQDKLERFASIFVNQCKDALPWDDAFLLNRLISDLEDLHIEILMLATSLPPQQVGSEALSTIIATDSHACENVYVLQERLPGHSDESIKISCLDLANKGLLFDDGSTRAGMYGTDWFKATPLSFWLVKRLKI